LSNLVARATTAKGNVTVGGAEMIVALPNVPDETTAVTAPGAVVAITANPHGNSNRTRTLYSVSSRSSPGVHAIDRRSLAAPVRVNALPLPRGGVPPPSAAAVGPAARRYLTRNVVGVDCVGTVGLLTVSLSTQVVVVALSETDGPTATLPWITLPARDRCHTVGRVRPAATAADGSTRRASLPVM